MGFETVVVPIGDKTVINVSLNQKEPERIALEEVKVTAQKRTVWGHNELIFESVDENPEFPGGVKELFAFISSNLKYPLEAQKNDISGKVFIKFIVRKDGSISDLKVLKGLGFGCDEETVRVLSQLPKWKPGKQNGEPVNVMFTMPVNFVMDADKSANMIEIPRSSANPVFKIRGINGEEQLFILDGKEIKRYELNQIEPDTIDSINVLKDKEAINIYGEKGKGGVIIIRTKVVKETKK
jgi:TonB family protein